MSAIVKPAAQPRCSCGRPLKVHVAPGRFGGVLVWATCLGCERTVWPYEGPLTDEAAKELERFKHEL